MEGAKKRIEKESEAVREEVEKVKKVVRVEVKRTSIEEVRKKRVVVFGLKKKEGRTDEEMIGDMLQVLGRKEECKPRAVFRMREKEVESVEGRAGSGKEQEGREDETEGEGGGREIMGRELSGSNRDGRGREMKVIFKNVRKIRSVVKQRECLAHMEKERVDICGINESGLNDDEFVDGGEGYEWFGCNRPAIEGKGGVNVILVNVYQKCEGVNVVENKERMAIVQKVTERARMKGEMLIVGGDFNGHIWELDGVENVNGRMLK
ncbi:hypothetical protein CAPTEDRAFT_185205 [Capitella teleta]|uniref:Endonuclease/exonuclease/phosphatase domain-containing protein n=1 Tax=Capitella teleta TaxID=283909 RepID=R7VFM4_CAPTE|nr:hypothetical protein CAPTEDRAFT_185205 [Capitella teleta]|eukprot:ELU14480.1 hypothetical protein CAPTEDRAFT_185205 [Capitella teleta]